jgi:hypothetical protein
MFLGLSVKCKFTSFNDHDVVFNWGDLSFDPFNLMITGIDLCAILLGV